MPFNPTRIARAVSAAVLGATLIVLNVLPHF